jgi:tRNA(adenine34) deaminase
MTMALEEAGLAFAEGEVPVGAVGVIQDKVVVRAHNRREAEQSPLGHAEIMVIDQAARQLKTWRLTELTLYVTLEPCLMCLGAMLQARIPKLVFGCRDPKAGACGSLYSLAEDDRLNHRIEVEEGILADHCSQILKDFFKERRR